MPHNSNETTAVFRKSVTFFILLALLWVLAWTYVPDQSPDHFSFSDLLRGLMLWFSLLCFGFALLMLLIRYKGVDLASRFIPHAGLILWLGKHAYQYSQPKTILFCRSVDSAKITALTVSIEQRQHVLSLSATEIKPLDLGFITTNPQLSWQHNQGQIVSQELSIKEHMKKMGRNLLIDITIKGDELDMKIR